MRDRCRQGKRRRGLPLGSILACLLLLMTLATGVTFSRYSTVISQGSDSARVARYVFDVNDAQSQSFDFTLDKMKQPGDKMDVVFVVTNANSSGICEVLQHYTLDIKRSDNLPLTTTLTETSNGAGQAYNQSRNEIGILPEAEEAVHTYNLHIEWSDNSKQEIYADEIEHFVITLKAEQVSGVKQ